MSAPLLRQLLGQSLAVAFVFGCQFASAEVVDAFGPVRIERITENQSYKLQVGTVLGSFISVQCFLRDTGGNVAFGAPDKFLFPVGGVTKVTLWNEEGQPTDVHAVGYKGGGFAILIVSKDKPNKPDDDEMQAALGVIAHAHKFLAYSVDGTTSTFDAMHMPAAWTRFGQLCH